MQHPKIKATDGEEFKNWEMHVKNLEMQDKLGAQSTIHYGILGTIGMVMMVIVLLVCWERIKTTIGKRKSPIIARELNIELAQIPTHRMATALNRTNTR